MCDSHLVGTTQLFVSSALLVRGEAVLTLDKYHCCTRFNMSHLLLCLSSQHLYINFSPQQEQQMGEKISNVQTINKHKNRAMYILIWLHCVQVHFHKKSVQILLIFNYRYRLYYVILFFSWAGELRIFGQRGFWVSSICNRECDLSYNTCYQSNSTTAEKKTLFTPQIIVKPIDH